MTLTDLFKFEQEQIEKWLKENTDYKAGAKKWAKDTAEDVKKTAEDVKESIEDSEKKYRITMMQTGIKVASTIYTQIEQVKQEDAYKQKLRDELAAANIENPALRNAYIEQIKSGNMGKQPVTQGVEYVVDRALLNCSYSGVANSNSDELAVMNVTEHVCVYANANAMKHDADCLPARNITFKFKNCNAPDYYTELANILSNLMAAISSEEIKKDPGQIALLQAEIQRYQNAFDIYNRSKIKTCVYPVLSHWMDADEKFEIKDFFTSVFDLDLQMNGLISTLKNWTKKIRDLTDEILFLYTSNGLDTPINPDNLSERVPSGRYPDALIISTLTDKIRKDFIALFEWQYDVFHACITNFGTGESFKKQIPETIKFMIDIKSKKWSTMNYIDYLEIDKALDEGIQYEKKNLLPSEYMDAFLTIARSTIIVAHRRKQLSTQELIDLFGAKGSSFWYNDIIDLIISTLRDFDKKLEDKANHPINCNSFLVCRLGGKITVQDGGQWYYVAKVALKSNFKIMIYDISEEIFGPHQAINEDGKGGVNGTEQYLKNMMEIDASIDANLREDTKKQLEFYQQMRICLKVLKDAEFADNGVLEVDGDCPLFVKVTVTPQFVIDEEIRQRNARLGFAIAAAGTISALFPEAALAGVVAWVGNSLTIISSVINLAEGSWGGGDTVNSVDLSAQGVAKSMKNVSGFMKNTATIAGEASSTLSTLNTVYTFISALDLMFQSGSDRYYPGKVDIEFIGLNYAYKCTQNYNRDGSLNGVLKSLLIPSEYYDETMRINSMHPGLYTNNEEIHKLYNEYEVVDYHELD